VERSEATGTRSREGDDEWRRWRGASSHDRSREVSGRRGETPVAAQERERERCVCGRVVGVGLLYTIITHFELGVVGFVGVGLICSIITHSELLDYE
jgi:hypothetical protein